MLFHKVMKLVTLHNTYFIILYHEIRNGVRQLELNWYGLPLLGDTGNIGNARDNYYLLLHPPPIPAHVEIKPISVSYNIPYLDYCGTCNTDSTVVDLEIFRKYFHFRKLRPKALLGYIDLSALKNPLKPLLVVESISHSLIGYSIHIFSKGV